MAISWAVNSHNFLDSWREYGLENIWHFNQLDGAGAYLDNVPVYIQPDRDLIARTLNQSFRLMSDVLNYAPVPVFSSEYVEFNNAIPLQRQMLRLRNNYVQAIGQRATTLIDDAVAIVYSDVSGIGVNDTATITVTDATTALDEIRVFFTVTDGALTAAHELYEIVPLTKSRTGNTVTITAHRANFVKPNGLWSQPYESPNFLVPNPGSNASAALFVTLVDVYRVYADATTAITVYGDDWLWNGGAEIDYNTTAGYGQLVRGGREGFVRVRWDCTTCMYPERVQIHYLAGYPLEYGRIETQLGTALFRLALCRMPRQRENPQHNRYYDLYVEDRQDMPFAQMSQSDIDNPFGRRRGEVEAWREIVRRIVPGAGSMSNPFRRIY